MASYAPEYQRQRYNKGFSINGVYNAQSYGAVGDGSTDDTLAIRNAINAGCGSGGAVYLPASPTGAGYKITYPLWENCNNGALWGSGGFGPIKPAYDFGFTLALVGSAYPGIPLTTSLVTGAGNAFDFRTDQVHNWLNLREWDGVNGPLGSPSGMNLNGLGTFSVEAFAVDTTAGDGVVVSSDSIPNSTTETRAWSLYINAARWGFHVTTSVGSCDATGSGSAVSVGTLQYLAGTYDGSTCRLYVCVPGQSNCAVTLSASQTGNLVQDPTEDVTIGPVDGQRMAERRLVARRYQGDRRFRAHLQTRALYRHDRDGAECEVQQRLEHADTDQRRDGAEQRTFYQGLRRGDVFGAGRLRLALRVQQQ